MGMKLHVEALRSQTSLMSFDKLLASLFAVEDNAFVASLLRVRTGAAHLLWFFGSLLCWGCFHWLRKDGRFLDWAAWHGGRELEDGKMRYRWNG